MKRSGIFSNVIWRFAERVGAQGVSFIVTIVLSRILIPEDYGKIALVSVFITIMNVFVDSGFGNALIQKKDADEIDFSSVFWFNIFQCVLLYGLLFVFAPKIAEFYQLDELTMVIRILGLQVIVSALKNVQQAYVARNMQFKRFFFATLGGTVGAAVIGIYMAIHGYGVWALVVQQLFNAATDTLILWCTVKWRPRLLFSFNRMKKLYSYGWKLLIAAILGNGYISLRQLIIGKAYSPSDLAYYNKGERFPELFILNIDSAIGNVIFPAMSQYQNDPIQVKNMTRRAIKTSIYVIAPIMTGLACAGESIVDVLLTSKWLPSVPYLQILCFSYILYPVSTANLNGMLAMGRSDMYLKLEIIKKAVGITALLLTMRISVMAMALSVLFTSVLAQAVNAWPNAKILGYRYYEQIRDILPELLLSGLMGISIYFLKYLNLGSLWTMIIQVTLGVGIYLVGSLISRSESYEYLKGTVFELIRGENEERTDIKQ